MKKIINFALVILLISIAFLFKNPSWNTEIYAQDDPYSSLNAAVDKLMQNAPGSGVFIVLPGGATISRNEGEQLPTFSVIKLWIAAAVFDAAENGEIEINDNTNSLVERMLTNSDNEATNQLIDLIGGFDRVNLFGAENEYFRTLLRRKMLQTPTPQNDNVSSPQDAVTFMQNLVNGNVVNLAASQNIISILQRRTATGSDPFKPNSPLPASADFIGKSGILGEGRNDVGSFLDAQGNRVFFAIFVPKGGAGTDQVISNLEQLMYNPSAQPTTLPPASQTPSSTTGQQTNVTSRACVKVGNPSAPKPDICNQPTTITTSGTPASGGGFGAPVAGAEPELVPCGTDPQGRSITCIKPAYVFYCQGDPRWGNMCGLTAAGCGPTTMAMIFSAYGDTITPPEVDENIFRGRYRACGPDAESSMQAAVQAVLPEKGYEQHALGVPLNFGRAQQYLDAGYLIIGSTRGHIFVIDGVNESSNTLSLRDPAKCENKDGVIRDASAPWGGQPLIYAYAVKKKPIISNFND